MSDASELMAWLDGRDETRKNDKRSDLGDRVAGEIAEIAQLAATAAQELKQAGYPAGDGRGILLRPVDINGERTPAWLLGSDPYESFYATGYDYLLYSGTLICSDRKLVSGSPMFEGNPQYELQQWNPIDEIRESLTRGHDPSYRVKVLKGGLQLLLTDLRA